MYLLSAVLFFLLTPGVLLTLPAGPSGQIWMSREMTLTAAAVHAVVFVIVKYALHKFLKY